MVLGSDAELIINVIAPVLLGVLAGTISGLTPGIHTNTIVALLLMFPYIFPLGNYLHVVIFIVSLATTHTFLDIIPSTYLGAPDSGTVLSVLPAHRYVSEGKGKVAVRLTLIGSVGALIIGAALYPIWVIIAKAVYNYIFRYMGFILLLLLGVGVVIKNENKLLSIVIVGLSSVIGIIGFEKHIGLFPILSGLFGSAHLITSVFTSNEKIKKQDIKEFNIKDGVTMFGIIMAVIFGFLSALLPGIGAGYGAYMASILANSDNVFLIAQGGITTANFFMSIASFNAINKARNGAILAIKYFVGDLMKLDAVELTLISTALLASGIAMLIGLYIGDIFPSIVEVLNYKTLSFIILMWIVIINLILNASGFPIFIICTGIGLLCNIFGVRRNLMMSSIIIPIAIKLL